MKNLIEIKQILNRQLPILKEQYRVENLGIFGSYTRNEQTNESDLDLLVEFEPDARFGLLTFCDLENYLSQLIGVEVDLVMKKGLKPKIGERILQEVQYL